jgi:hypothetical protein
MEIIKISIFLMARKNKTRSLVMEVGWNGMIMGREIMILR